MTTSNDESEEIICQEELTGLGGKLVLDDLKVVLTAFGQDITRPPAGPLHFLLKKGGYATLLDWIQGGNETRYSLPVTVHSQEFLAGTILVGPHKWTSDDRVRSLSFTFSNADLALFYMEHMNDRALKLRGKKKKLHVHVFDPDRSVVTTLDVGALTITIRMSTKIEGLSLNQGISSTPLVEVSFREPLSLKEVHRVVRDIISFFELSLGVPCQMSRVEVSSLTEQEVDSYWDKNEFPPSYEVRWLQNKSTPQKPRGHHGDAIFKAARAAWRSQLNKSLKRWMERRKDWQVAYSLMDAYLVSERMYGSLKVLRLMAWFESIPTNIQGPKITNSQIEKLAAAARRRAGELEVSITTQRLREVLRMVKYLPLHERIERAIKMIKNKFGAEYVKATLLEDCVSAIKIRNSAAHGSSPGRVSGREWFNMVHALELVCALSMLLDLKVQKKTLKLVNRHPLMSYQWNDRAKD